MILCETLQEHIVGLGQLGVVQEVSLGEGCIFRNKLTTKLFKTWGMERRSVTKVLRALSKASSPYNLGFQSVRSAISSMHRRGPNNLAHILVYISALSFKILNYHEYIMLETRWKPENSEIHIRAT